jgi:hypothetical protein
MVSGMVSPIGYCLFNYYTYAHKSFKRWHADRSGQVIHRRALFFVPDGNIRDRILVDTGYPDAVLRNAPPTGKRDIVDGG